jgi:DNA mismatch repair protein MutS2
VDAPHADHSIQEHMHEKSLVTLEYLKIIARLVDEAAFSASKELARALTPSPHPAEARRRLDYTTEARHLLDLRPDVGVRGARDIRPQVAAAMRDATLSPENLLDVLATARSSAYLGRLMRRLDEGLPLLGALARDLPERPQLEARIGESIGEDGSVLDSASPVLRRIRMELRTAQQRLQDRLGTLVSEFRGALQEGLITQRGGRYVLPVRAEARSQVRGIVHDQSSSGATLFVEPLVIVEMNNRIRELEAEERHEVERILRELSGLVAADAPYLTLAVELLAEIDLHLAKARYASLIRAGVPKVTDDGTLRLRQARHPLLTGKVVPLDFWLNRETWMVVITGPNTGGKTVALKTVGLLCLMAQAGIHIPAEDGSELPVYENIFADIGDEQSIEQSLSTFSSHLSRIVEILREATPRSLVLLDELGAGTDPTEGSALARAILTHLLEAHIATVATTHYSELKVFAHDRPGVTNASVEFDVETLSPTYHLSIGLPGRSNALAIAARLGLSEDIIERAREYVGSAGVEMENLLEGLQSERAAAADERFQLSMERAEAEHQRREAQRQREETEAERARILNDARALARREVEAVQAELARLRKQARNPNLSEERLASLRERARRLDERTAPTRTPARKPVAAPEDEREEGALAVGDTVYVRGMGQRGELLSTPDAKGEAEVQVGSLKLRVNAGDLDRLSKRQAHSNETPPRIATPTRSPEEAPELQLDLRGWRVEDALEEVETYLDNAALAGLSFVRLLHGKGTGALRQAIRQRLAHNPLVQSFASAAPNDGGDGVTIVTLAA